MRNQTMYRKMDIIDVVPSTCVDGVNCEQNTRLLTIIGAMGMMYRALKASVCTGMNVETVHELLSQLECSARVYKNEISRMMEDPSKNINSKSSNSILHINEQ
jgi:hypothetical protein